MAQQAEARRGRIPFEPALEGLRGFALIGMLCFHAEFQWAVGGFLPIPTFFTLSGYLITSLFLVEWERTGSIRLRTFWARRFRRLMPASLLTLAGISLFGAFVATPDQLARLRGDVLWALAYAANWRFLFSDTAYAELFLVRSPVLHFWSLGIEEQFYLAFPLIAVLGLRLGSGSRAVFGAVLGALVAGSVLASWALTTTGASVDRVYYGTDTRGAELLMGGLLALLLCGREITSRTLRRVIQALGAVAMLVMVGLWTVVDLDPSWLYLGGFAAYTLLSVAVIAAGVQPSGPVRVLLSSRAIRWIGRVSYGAYLFHWPVYLWLSPERTGLEQWPLFAVRGLLTFGLAGISYEFFEAPIRRGRALKGWRPFVVTPVAFATVALAAVVVTAGPRGGRIDFGAESQPLEKELTLVPSAAPEATETPSSFQDLQRVAVYGDSSALMLGMALGYWLMARDGVRPRDGEAELGCGLARKGTYRFRGKEYQRRKKCGDRDVTWAESIQRERPDLAVVLVGPWEVCDRKLPGDDSWRHPGDPVLDTYLQQEMLSVVDLLSSEGALVIWLTHPTIQVLSEKLPKTPYPESDRARMVRFDELIFELEKLRPGTVRVVDLAGYMRTLPGGEMDPSYRPDGTHFSIEGAGKVWNDWLAAEVLRVYHDEASRTPRN
jgi:peptidoglycan/LPS O-acetylase OafA/YrhL